MTPLLERIQQARAREAAQAGAPPSDSQPLRLPYSSWLEPAQDGAYTRETFLERWLEDLETPTELNRCQAEKKQDRNEIFHSLPPKTKQTTSASRPWTTGCLVEPLDTVELRCVGAFASQKQERPLTTALSISLDEEASPGGKSPVKAPASCPSNIKGRL